MNTEELKRLAEAATPGPWEVDDMLADLSGIEICSAMGMVCDDISENDARFVASANPAVVLELIRQRDELLAALKNARELVEDWGAYASAYMQEKHDLKGDMDKLDAAIANAEKQS